MNKTVLLGVGGIISIAALVVLMQDDAVEFATAQKLPQEAHVASENIPDTDDVSIRYETQKMSESALNKPAETKHLPREKYLESKTYDRSKNFEIALINKNLQDARKPSGSTTLQGSIDGEPFFLKVPKALIEEGSGITELRVTNLKTNGVSTVSAAFIDDMRNPSVRQRIDIDSKNLENYVQKEVEAIVPPRPGEAVR